MFLKKTAALLTLSLMLNACAHKTAFTQGTLQETPENFCNFKRYHLNLDHRNGGAGVDPSVAPNVNSGVEDLTVALAQGFRARGAGAIPKDDMLFLSGGSLNGAFGAGVLQGWAEKEGRLPDFSVVTGVSTGAILSLAAFTNKPMAAVEGYTVESESEAIDAFVRRDENGRVKTSSYLTAVRKGALADISPLKDTTYDIVARYDIFPEIATRAAQNRKLLTGVVDIDTGEAVALDMTDMAVKIMDAVSKSPDQSFAFQENETIAELKTRAPRVGHYVDCFTSAIAASSSVPVAALPIAIDNRLYIDGGARFLVFSDVIGPLIEPKASILESAVVKRPQIYAIINSDQKITPKCAKKLCDEASAGFDYWDVEGEREDWNVLSLVERTVDIMKTQVGEFSEAELRLRALEVFLEERDIDLRSNSFARLTDAQKVQIFDAFQSSAANYNINSLKIEPETLEHIYKGKTCTQWRKHDEITDRNLQFHLNYMKCTISAGKAVIKNEGWK